MIYLGQKSFIIAKLKSIQRINFNSSTETLSTPCLDKKGKKKNL
jgi:hypothetical protein